MPFSQLMDQNSNDGEQTAFDDFAAVPNKKPRIHGIHCLAMKESRQLPEKYKLLSELFGSMLLSLMTLSYQKQLPLYRYICLHVKLHTGRPFSYRDLAQIKSILPEAVQTDKILLHNPETLCMEPQLKVTLRFDVVAGHTEFCDSVALSREFYSRLFKLVDTHSEDYDVPEAELPKPFNTRQIRVSPTNFSVDEVPNYHRILFHYLPSGLSPSPVLGGEISSASGFCAKPELLKLCNKRKMTISPNLLPMDLSRKELPSVDEAELLNAFHMRPSFLKQLSAKDEESAKMELSSSLVLPSSLKSDTTVEKETGFSACADQTEHENSFQVSNGGTLMKNSFILAEKNVETSNLSFPKRSVGTEHNKLNSMRSKNAMTSGLLAKRFSDFSITDDEGVLLEGETTFAAGPSSKYQQWVRTEVHH